MTKRSLFPAIVVLLVLVVALLMWNPFGRKDAPSNKPSPLKHNVVFVSFDALGASHVGHLGHHRKVTPTLDKLAEQGWTFRHNYSVSSWTVPASMTWFTGAYPSEHRMVNKYAIYNANVQKISNLKQLAPDLLTLAEVMRQNGAVTAGFTGNAGVSGGFGYEQGFDVYYHPKGKFGSFTESIPRALEWLKENKERRFFLFLHGYDVHGQCTPAEGFDYRFRSSGYDKRYTGSEQEQEILREEGLEQGKLTMREEDVRFWRAIYDEKINRADAKFKHFLDEFDKLGLMDNTLFVITSDHGTEFYEHRRFDHGFTLYNELIHVPLIIKMPGENKGKVISERVSSIDIMPTILDLVEAEVPAKLTKQMRGQSLVPVMQGGSTDRDIFSETDYREYTFKRSIITPEGWKLIVTLENNKLELYNLKADPEEKMNLAKSESRRVEDLRKKLFAHFKAIGHDLTQREWKVGFNPVYPSQAKDPPKK